MESDLLQKQFQKIVEVYRSYSPQASKDQLKQLRQAYDFGKVAHDGQFRESGEPFFTHPLAVAEILTEYKADVETLVAAMLHDTIEDCPCVSKKSVEHIFGKTISKLIEGVTKISKEVTSGDKKKSNQETLRKIFLYARKDPRVIFIKLADRIHNMRTLRGKNDPKKRKKKAQETIDIYMPVAAELGIWKIKKELEKTAMPHLHPRDYQDMYAFLEKEEKHQEEILSLFSKELEMVDDRNVISEILIHQRGYYTLHKVRQERTPPHLSIHDILMLKCIVDKREDCYSLLAAVHSRWQGRHGELKDYISCPKANGYQGLHTTVITESGYAIHLRLLTHEMHMQDSFGMTHDVYVRNNTQCDFLAPLKKIHKATKENSSDFMQGLKQDILQEKITVHSKHTPNIVIPKDATALDFAFLTLKEKASQVLRIFINSKQQPLSRPLKEGDFIEIDLSEKEQATFQWFYFMEMQQSRILLQEILKKKDHNHKVLLGKQILQQYFDRHLNGSFEHYTHKKSFSRLLETHDLKLADDLYVLIYEGVIDPGSVYKHLCQKKAYSFDHYFQKIFQCFRSKSREIKLKLEGLSEENALVHQMIDICKRTGIKIRSYKVTSDVKDVFQMKLSCMYDKQSRLDTFVTLLEKQNNISGVQILLSRRRQMELIFWLTLMAFFWLGSFFFLDYLSDSLVGMSQMVRNICVYGVLASILYTNYLFYSFIRSYISEWRSNVMMVILGIVSNVFAVIMFTNTLISHQLDNLHLSLFFPITVFLLYALFMTLEYVHHSSFYMMGKSEGLPFSLQGWEKKKKEKMIGYALRFGAVIIWGIEPIFIKYSAVNTIDPLLRVGMKGIGGLIPPLLIFIAIYYFSGRGQKLSFHIERNYIFWIMVIAEVVKSYFVHASLIHTSSINFTLLTNFAPVFALIFATFFLKDRIPYLKNAKTVFQIFMIFIIGSLGSTLLFYNDIKTANAGSLYGDLLATFSMLADVVFVVAAIEYIKSVKRYNSLQTIINSFALLLLISVVGFLALAPYFGQMSLLTLTKEQWMLGLAAGALNGVGLVLNFESFKRIDGFLAYLMFNVAILVTFIFEVVVFQKITPTWLLIIGGGIIISASIFAEWINSRCEKTGL